MKLANNLKLLSIGYPKREQTAENLLETPLGKYFRSTSKIMPFLEQYASEQTPHRIKHIFYEFGLIQKRKAIRFYYDKTPMRIIYSNVSDPLINHLNAQCSSKVYIPPGTVTATNARVLRERALKWIVEQFFLSINYLCFDEPQLDTVTPDLLVVPNSDATKILNYTSGQSNGQKKIQNHIEIDSALFVEIKAFHQSTIVGEKELLQAYNYGVRGGKALLITSGTLGSFEALSILQRTDNSTNSNKEINKEQFEKFIATVKAKNRALIKALDFSVSQDMFDNRGIYASAVTKLEKIYKHTDEWPNKIEYEILSSPAEIIKFLSTSGKLGIIVPEAFISLLQQQKLDQVAKLMLSLRRSYIEEIVINPNILYPE